MQFKLSFVALALATVATAIPTGGDNSCNVGQLQCCNQVQSAGSLSPNTISQLGLLGIAVGALNLPVGLNCNPISVIGVGGNNCAAQPVCCSNNNFNGVVALGCTPVNVNL